MKTLLLALSALFLTAPAFATETPAKKIQCSVTLLAPFPDSGKTLWIAPMAGVYVIDYDPSTELTVKLAVVQVSPPGNPFVQYSLDDAKGEADTALTLEFSKTSPDGNKYSGDTFGVYFRKATDGLNSPWQLGAAGMAASAQIDINKDASGYLVMTCL